MRPLSLTLTPRGVGLTLFGATCALLAGHLLVTMGSEVTGHPLFALPRWFDLGGEANLPTYFASANLLFAAALTAVAAAGCERRWVRVGWWGLALGFALMSLDEATLIHEGIVGGLLVHKLGRGEGAFYYRWYLVYIPLVVMLGAVYAPFLRALPWRTAAVFAAAGALFLTGAIGVEMVESGLTAGDASRVRVLVNLAVEEGAELLGISLFNVGLTAYLARRGSGVTVGFGLRGASRDPSG